MRDTVIRELIRAEAALSTASFNLIRHGRWLGTADTQDMKEHLDELDALLRAFQQLANEIPGPSAT